MQLEIRPEPTQAERAAIEAALRALEADGGGRGAWWAAGVAESLDGAGDGDDGAGVRQAIARPRSTDGARRA